jgi:sialic acid synthase SpsE
MARLSLASRQISCDDPVLVIAEIGVNHDGSLERALELVDRAANAGADAVKLQIFRADTLMHASSAFASYQKEQCDDSDPGAMLRRYELPTAAIRRIVEAICAHKLIPLATPFSVPDVELIGEFDMPAIKIASPDLVNYPLLKRAAELGKPLLISTGAATMEEVATTVGWLREWRRPFALLHCVSSYPTPSEEANLCWIGELAGRFGVPVGYSDHTTEELAGALSVMAGACIIEKHLTYDRGASGPDHAASANPEQFARYVRGIRLAEQMRGRAGKRVLGIEEDVRRVSRQSLVLRRDLPAGHALQEEDLTVQRPAAGIPAAGLPEVLGKRLRRALPAATILQHDLLR